MPRIHNCPRCEGTGRITLPDDMSVADLTSNWRVLKECLTCHSIAKILPRITVCKCGGELIRHR